MLKLCSSRSKSPRHRITFLLSVMCPDCSEQSNPTQTPFQSRIQNKKAKARGRMILVPVAYPTQVTTGNPYTNENDNDNHSYDGNRNHKNNVSKRKNNNMTQQQRGQEPRRRKNADPIECSYKMLEDATRIGSNSIPRDSMQECATVQFWRLDRGEDLLRWCHRTRRLILLMQN